VDGRDKPGHDVESASILMRAGMTQGSQSAKRVSDTRSQSHGPRMPKNDLVANDLVAVAQSAMEIEDLACAHCAAASAEPWPHDRARCWLGVCWPRTLAVTSRAADRSLASRR